MQSLCPSSRSRLSRRPARWSCRAPRFPTIQLSVRVTRLTELKSHFAIPLHDGACLRPVSPSDITDAYVDGLNDPVVNKFLGQSRKNRQTRDTVHAYVQANERDPHGVLL